MDFSDSSTFSTASGKDYHYVVLQVTLKEKFLGTGSGNLTELEEAINHQAQKGYRLHTITTSNGGSKGLMGGDRIQATMVFEKVIYRQIGTGKNLFACQSAVNYRLNLCKANKMKKRAVLVLTRHKEYGIVIMHRINCYSSA